MRIDDFPRFQKRVKTRVQAIKEQGYTVAERSRQFGLDVSYISSIVHPQQPRKKKSYIIDEYLPRLAKTLDCDEDYLTFAQDQPRL